MVLRNDLSFCGDPVSGEAWSLISEICRTYSNLSQTELASTICELLQWRRPNGKLKTTECFQFLKTLQSTGHLTLPATRAGRPPGSRMTVKKRDLIHVEQPCTVALPDLRPIRITLVETSEQRWHWQALVDRYHYLGYKTPFGARLQYFIVAEETLQVLGCLQFSSPALKLRAREAWIGWSSSQKKARLQRIIQNSRFLILPWIRVKNLASHVLRLAARTVTEHWQSHYGESPVLLETFVERRCYPGTCYRAANWIHIGTTQGRGRQDRDHAFPSTLKDIWVKPLCKNWRTTLVTANQASRPKP